MIIFLDDIDDIYWIQDDKFYKFTIMDDVKSPFELANTAPFIFVPNKYKLSMRECYDGFEIDCGNGRRTDDIKLTDLPESIKNYAVFL